MAKRKLAMKHTPKPKSDGKWWCCIGIMAVIIVAFAVACYFFGLKNAMKGVLIIGIIMYVILSIITN